MKGYPRVVVVMMALLIWVSSLQAQEQCTPWKKIRESEGVIGYARMNPRSPFSEIKAIGIVEASVASIEAVMRDVPSEKRWMFMCADAYRIDLPNLPGSPDSYYSYFRQGLPWPVSDRLAVVRHTLTIDKQRGILTFRGEGIDVEYQFKDKGIRLPLVEVDCVLVPKGANRTEVTYQILPDVGGSLPIALINLLTRSLGVDTIKNLRKVVKEEPYRSARTIVTTTPRSDDRL